MAISGITVAILAPLLGAIADRGGPRKPWILVFTLGCVLSGACLWFVAPGQQSLALALILAGVANAAFEFGTVFYNAMLPDLASKRMIGRVSGWAWGLGYLGGLACLGLTLVLLIQPEVPPFGLDKETQEQVRAVGPLVALWYFVFAWPLFFFTPDRPSKGKAEGGLVGGLKELGQTLRGLKHHPNIVLFLVARLFYIDGLATLFAFGGIYAAGSFDMSIEEVLFFGVLLNVTAGAGAFAFGWIDDWIGPKRAILISLVCLLVFGAAILVAEGKTWFYILGSAIGIFIGPVQSASRSMMAHMAPREQRTQLFGLFALSGKVTAFLGPALGAALTAATQSQRLGMSVILALFLIGFVLLLFVRYRQDSAH